MNAANLCPDLHDLKRFAAGDLTDDDAEPIEQHLLACRDCVSRLSDIDAKDTFVNALRATPPSLSVPTIALPELPEADPAPRVGEAPQDTADLPQGFGRYKVTAQLGRGGCGVVYRGFDPELRRNVAIKVPRADRIAAPGDAAAYLNEARVVASLNHPGIVPVFDCGQTGNGVCFVVSQFIGGGDMAAMLARERPQHNRAAEIVAEIAEALHHAHQQGLVHRDVKPGNILINERGQPMVGDFGLALTEESYGRPSGAIGTPSYMSPEQARGDGDLVDARSDIYSLGVVFYELLTGRRPYRCLEPLELLKEIAAGEVRPPRQFDHTIALELERICLKALARNPADRYTTAYDMGDELRRYCSGDALEGTLAQSSIAVDGHKTTSKRQDGEQKAATFLRERRIPAAALALLFLCGIVAAVTHQKSADQSGSVIYLTFLAGPVNGDHLDVDRSRKIQFKRDGRASGDSLSAPLGKEDAFRLEGRFDRPTYWRLLWRDTRGKWSAVAGANTLVDQFAYPDDGAGITVDEADPLGTHLLFLITSNVPLSNEKLIEHVKDAEQPPPLNDLRIWLPSSGGTTFRGAGSKVTTLTSCITRLSRQLPNDCRAVAAVFMPVVHRQSPDSMNAAQ